jgi:Sensors of blue-light using FAD
VEHIYSRISLDKRHTALRVLVDETVEARLFAQWSMGFQRPDPASTHQHDLFAATREAIEKAIPLEKAAVAARLVRTFYTVNAGNYAG